MANKVNVTLDLEVSGYTQGLDKATQSTKAYETETRKVADAQVNLKKELVAARKLVQNLTAGYEALDAEAKQSSFGKEMKRQLEQAEQAAANYLDMQQDINTKLKNMASDTQTFNIMADSIGLIGDATSATMGVIAEFTGNEEDARRAVVAFTTAQAALGAVTKIQNALQKESNIMLGIAKIQSWAAARATQAQTSATVGATIAQKAFNAVAKANPYVLLASAVLTVVSAFAMFSLNSDEVVEDQNKINIAFSDGKKAAEAYTSSLTSEYAKLMTSYSKLKNEWANLSNNKDRKKFVRDHKSELESLGAEIKNVSDAENFFANDTDRIVQGFIARAKAAAYAAKLTELYRQQMEILDKADNLKSDRYREGGAVAEHEFGGRLELDKNGNTYNGGKYYMDNGVVKYTKEGAQAAFEASRAFQELSIAYSDNETQINKAENSLREYMSTLETGTVTLGDSSKTTNTGLKAQANSIAELENSISLLQERAKKGLLPADLNDPAKFKAALKKMQSDLTELKVKWGFEDPKSVLDKLEADLKQKQLLLRADIPQEQKDKIYQEILELKDKIQKEKFKAHIEIDPSIEANKEIDRQINEILKSTTEVEKPTWNFSNIIEVDPKQEKMLNSLVNQYNRLYDAREKLSEMMNADGASDDQIAKSQKALEQMEPLFAAILDKLNMFKDVNTELETSNEKTKKLANTMTKVGEVTQSVGEAFAALGEATDDAGVKIMGIVAKAIATVALSFAQALASTKTWVEWLAFGATGFGTMLSMISQIKQVTAGSYAHGGIVGGNSYSGDKLMAWVNSGEAILNKHQQKNLFDILDGKMTPYNNANTVEVTGVVHGTDLLLVQKNTSKVMKRAGNKIKII